MSIARLVVLFTMEVNIRQRRNDPLLTVTQSELETGAHTDSDLTVPGMVMKSTSGVY